MPDAGMNLLSEGCLDRKGLHINKANQRARVLAKGKLLFSGELKNNNLYLLDCATVLPEIAKIETKASALATTKQTSKIATIPDVQMLHHRLAHFSNDTIVKMIRTGAMEGFGFSSATADRDFPFCEPCELGKAKALPFPKVTSNQVATRPLQRTHMDSTGRAPVAAIDGGYYYALYALDGHTNYLRRYFCQTKEQMSAMIEYDKKCVERHWKDRGYAYVMAEYQVDGGSEFINKKVKAIMHESGVEIRVSAPYTHEQNGKAERIVGVVSAASRTVRLAGPKEISGPKFWAESHNHVVPVRNALLTKAKPLSDQSPFEQWYGRKPNITEFHAWGTFCVALIRDKKNKLVATGERCLFLGLAKDYKAYRLFSLDSQKIKVSRDVRFHDTLTKWVNAKSVNPLEQATATASEDEIVRELVIQFKDSETPKRNAEIAKPAEIKEIVKPVTEVTDGGSDAESERDYDNADEEEVSSKPLSASKSLPILDVESDLNIRFPAPTLNKGRTTLAHDAPRATPLEHDWTKPIEGKRSVRLRKDHPVNQLLGSETKFSHSTQMIHALIESPDTIDGIDEFIPAEEYPLTVLAMTHTPTREDIIIPKNFDEAMKSKQAPQWKEAIVSEITSLNEQDVFTFVERTREMRPIKGMWIFDLKRDLHGIIDRFKGRLVAKGYTQKYGHDYLDSYAPVFTYTTLRIFLSIVAKEDWEIVQRDIKTAFLNNKLDREIFMEVPEGMEVPKDGKDYVVRLNRALYGLKQSSRLHYLLQG